MVMSSYLSNEVLSVSLRYLVVMPAQADTSAVTENLAESPAPAPSVCVCVGGWW